MTSMVTICHNMSVLHRGTIIDFKGYDSILVLQRFSLAYVMKIQHTWLYFLPFLIGGVATPVSYDWGIITAYGVRIQNGHNSNKALFKSFPVI
jgi:hypothetical protein